jgi:hypothetical protein
VLSIHGNVVYVDVTTMPIGNVTFGSPIRYTQDHITHIIRQDEQVDPLSLDISNTKLPVSMSPCSQIPLQLFVSNSYLQSIWSPLN